MVRLADEIVDTYDGASASELLDNFHQQVRWSIVANYSTNPLVHAFGLTAQKFHIEADLIEPFFNSMQADLSKKVYRKKKELDDYVYGSAEVVGLMCLKVFVEGNDSTYNQLKDGARALGAAYQKVNFLRDIKTDYEKLGRVYFPGIDYKSFNERDKQKIIQDIKKDFELARLSIEQLPKNTQKAVRASYYHYTKLLQELEKSSVDSIKSERIRIPNIRKFGFLLRAAVNR